MKNLFIFRAFKSALSRFRIYKSAFSLVEMLMALLVASLLLAALAPVMTRKMNENLHITGEFTNNGRSVVKEIAYGDAEFCPTIVRDSNGDELYCEGEYTVPDGFKNITVTAIGAGGGGGTAPTAGYIEYINEGAAETFTVPAMVDNLEATLISGGAGGGAGGQVEDSVPYTTAGEFTWNVPAIAKNKYAVVTACGGGGGGGGFVTANYISGAAGGLGGGGGYFSRAVLASNNNYSVIIGGGGGGGAAASSTSYAQGLNGTAGSGGGGGGDAWGDQSGTGGRGGKNGGTAGYTRGALSYFGLGGERGDTSLSSNTDGNNGTLGSHAAGGNGSSAGGSALWGSIYKPDGTPIAHGQGAGGGGGSITGYGAAGAAGAAGAQEVEVAGVPQYSEQGRHPYLLPQAVVVAGAVLLMMWITITNLYAYHLKQNILPVLKAPENTVAVVAVVAGAALEVVTVVTVAEAEFHIQQTAETVRVIWVLQYSARITAAAERLFNHMQKAGLETR